VNTSAHVCSADDDENAVTLKRIRDFNTVTAKKSSFADFIERHISLHAVRQVFNKNGDRKSFRLICCCANFWNNNSHCSHVLAVYHLLGHINVFAMMSGLNPVRKRGRPTCREKALEKDRDTQEPLDVMSINPAKWRKQPVRHQEYLNGMVYNFRVKPDKKRTPVWKVRYPDAPGGMQDFEIGEDEFKDALKLYQAWSALCGTITANDD
jgi:hypothetical protein